MFAFLVWLIYETWNLVAALWHEYKSKTAMQPV